MAKSKAAARARDEDDAEVRVTDYEAELGDIEELESDALDEVKWWLYRARMDGTVVKSENPRGAYLVKGVGPLDLDKVREKHGGGWYLLRTKNPDGSYRKSVLFEIEGPAMVTSSPASSSSPGGAPGDLMAEMKKQLRDEVETLKLEYQARFFRERLLAPTPATVTTPTRDPLDDLSKLVNVVRALMPAPTQPADASKTIEFALGLADRLEGLRRDAAGGSSWADVARDAIKDTLPQLLDVLGNRGAPARPRAVGASAAASPASAPNGTASPPPVNRVVLIADMIAGAFSKQTEPSALADAAEEVLSEDELARIRAGTDDQVLAVLDSNTDRFRELATRTPQENEQALRMRAYVREFLVQLKTPPADAGDVEPGATG